MSGKSTEAKICNQVLGLSNVNEACGVAEKLVTIKFFCTVGGLRIFYITLVRSQNGQIFLFGIKKGVNLLEFDWV